MNNDTTQSFSQSAETNHMLDAGIADLMNNVPLSTVLAGFGEHRAELEPLLRTALTAINIPTLSVPRPRKRNRFAQLSPSVRWQWRMVSFMRMSMVPLSLIFVLLGISTVAYGTQSLPGERLYGVRTKYEQIRVSLATDPADKAKLQLSWMDQKIKYAETILNSDVDEKTKTAAISALTTQTKTAVNDVLEATAEQALGSNSSDTKLLESLQQLTTKQETILIAASDQPKQEAVASSARQANEENKKTLATVKKLIASVNEPTPAHEADADIAITGTVSAVGIKQSSIIVEKNTFLIDESTAITKNDVTVKSNELVPNSKVSVVGQKHQGTVIATKIIILEQPTVTKPTAPAVKGVATKDENANPSTATVNETITPEPTELPEPTSGVRAGFIVEDPTPQTPTSPESLP